MTHTRNAEQEVSEVQQGTTAEQRLRARREQLQRAFFDNLHRATIAQVRAILYSRVRCSRLRSDDVDDIEQQTYVDVVTSLMKKAARIQTANVADYVGLVVSVVQRRVVDCHRTRTRRRQWTTSDVELDESPDESQSDALDSFSCSEETQELGKAIHETIRSLDDRKRGVVELWMAGHSHDEIAARVNGICSAEHSRVELQRAQELIGDRLRVQPKLRPWLARFGV